MSRLMKAVNSILTQTNKVSQAMSGSLLQRDDSPGDRKARGVRGKTTLSPKNPFAVKESDSGEKQELPKTRIYLKTGEKPPTGVFIQQGPRGGKFYMGDPNARSGDNANSGDGDDTAKKVRKQPDANPERVVKPNLASSQTVDVEDVGKNMLERIKASLAERRIPPATTTSDGYKIIQIHGDYDVSPKASDKAETRKLARAIEDAIDAGGFDYRREDDTVHVKPEIKAKQDDESVQDEMGKLADRLDPLQVKKAMGISESIHGVLRLTNSMLSNMGEDPISVDPSKPKTAGKTGGDTSTGGSPTSSKTSTSTEADTKHNITVTGGAGEGATTTVTIKNAIVEATPTPPKPKLAGKKVDAQFAEKQGGVDSGQPPY